AAEGLVPRLPAPAQGVVLPRCALGAACRSAVRAEELNATGDAIRAVLGHLDPRRPGVLPVDLPALLPAADRVAQRPGRAVPHRTDDLVHAPAAGGHERLGAGAEHRRQAVRAQPRVLAYAAVVEDRQLLTRIAVAPVGDPLGVLGVAEADPGAAAVAPGPDRRLAAPAQRELRRRAALRAQVVDQPRHVGHQVRPVVRRLDRGREPGLELPEVGTARLGLAGRHEPAGQLL